MHFERGLYMALKMKLFIISLVILLPFFIQAQDSKKTRFLIILDCSGSMATNMGNNSKMQVARRVINNLVDSLSQVPNVEVALRSYGQYGSKTEENCKDTRLEVGFYRNNVHLIKERLEELKPNGTTPIAYSLTQAANDFPNSTGKNIIILVTDGLEECKGDPCAVSQALQSRNVILKPFIIGLSMKEDYSKHFECVGRFYNANSETDFKDVLATVMTQALNNTTVQVNLNNEQGKPTETNLNMTFYNAKSGAVAYNFYHTLNGFGRPDTFIVDPIIMYNLVVHTTPQVTLENITINPSQHNIIRLRSPQGSLQLNVKSTDYGNLKCLVKNANTGELIYVQDFGTSHNYLTGNYDLEILTLPRIYINNAAIKQDETNTVEIPSPGKLDLSFPANHIASIFVMRNNKQEWVMDLKKNRRDKEIIYLQPGSYKIVYRPQNAKKTRASHEQDFRITSNQYTSLNLD